MDIFQNLNILFVGLVVFITMILGFIVYLNNPKSITNKTFFVFALITSIWGIFNYLSYQTQNFIYVLWLIRFVIFFAIWQAYTLFLLIYVFPKDNAILPFWIKKLLFPAVIFTSVLTLTPLVFSDIKISSSGQVSSPVLNWGIVIFAVVGVSLVLMGIVLLLCKVIVSTGDDRKRLIPILIGVSLMFLLIIIFNLIAVVVFNTVKFIPFGVFFIFPFIVFTFYAIFKHKLFNLKVISVEFFIFVIWITLLVKVFLAEGLTDRIVSAIIFIIIFIFGIILIKSVLKEVKIREEIQKLYGDLKLTDEKLKKVDEEKSEFLFITSHQLRSPMTVIKGYISMILEGSLGKISDKMRESLNKVYISNDRLIKLINDLLDLSRIERGKMDYTFNERSLEKIVSEAVQELKMFAEDKGLKVLFNKPKDELPNVLLDEDYIRQVVVNLIDNAIKYTDKGDIEIKIEQTNGGVLLSITDEGKGISKEMLLHLFERYSREEKTYSKAAKGMGLGLYIAKKIVDDHKGKIWARSMGEGKGATFFVELPVAE